MLGSNNIILLKIYRTAYTHSVNFDVCYLYKSQVQTNNYDTNFEFPISTILLFYLYYYKMEATKLGYDTKFWWFCYYAYAFILFILGGTIAKIIILIARVMNNFRSIYYNFLK